MKNENENRRGAGERPGGVPALACTVPPGAAARTSCHALSRCDGTASSSSSRGRCLAAWWLAAAGRGRRGRVTSATKAIRLRSLFQVHPGRVPLQFLPVPLRPGARQRGVGRVRSPGPAGPAGLPGPAGRECGERGGPGGCGERSRRLEASGHRRHRLRLHQVRHVKFSLLKSKFNFFPRFNILVVLRARHRVQRRFATMDEVRGEWKPSGWSL